MLLWLVIGGLFFGAVQDFGALYASVKNEGKSMGMIIEKYIGKTGRKLFIVVAVIFGLIQKKVGTMKEWVRAVVAILLMVLGVMVALSCLKKLFTAKKEA